LFNTYLSELYVLYSPVSN